MRFDMMEKTLLVTLLLVLNMPLCSAGTNSEHCCRISDIPSSLAYDCSNCGLTSIPKTIPSKVKTFMLRNNSLRTLDGSFFKHFTSLDYLDVSMNKISNFTQDAFIGLSRLRYLDISQEDVIPVLTDSIFVPLVQLESLCLGRAFFQGKPFPGNWINALTPNLKNLELAVPRKYVFTQEFARLKNLENLIITGQGCQLQTITNDTFRVFSKSPIKTLEVKQCYLQDITPESLSMFSSLENLNFACNYHKSLDFKMMFEAAKNLPSDSLHTMVLDGSGRKNLNTISGDLFNSSSFSNVKRLSLRSTLVAAIDVNFLKHIPRLEHINLGFNTIMKVMPEDKDHALNMSMNLVNSMNISTVDVSYFGTISGSSNNFRRMFCWPNPAYTNDFFQKSPSYISIPQKFKKGNRTIDYTHFDELETFLETNVPLSLQHVYAKHIGITTDDFSGFQFNPNNILHIDVSENLIRSISGPLTGFDNLQGLDLNSCGLVEIVPEALKHLTNLVLLNLSINSFTSENLDFLKHVGNNTNLKFLDLSYNLLTHIGNTDYGYLASAEVLNFTGNGIVELTTDFSGNPNLRSLDLSNCSLTSLPEHVTKGFDSLHRKSSGAFCVQLQGNPWNCNCDTLDFLLWLRSTHVNIHNEDLLTCLHDNDTIEIRSVDLAEMNSVCNPTKVSIATPVTISLLMFASLLVTSLSYHYRWTLKWKFYMIRRKFRMMSMNMSSKDEQLLPENSMSTEITCDAFVSYNHEADYEWVLNTLLEKVEESWNFKLCVGQRDFIFGVPVAENICEAIDNSRFTIIVITPAFLLSEWCQFELHMALTRGCQHLIIIYKEEVDISQLSKTVRTAMMSVNCIEYSENSVDQGVFWQRLHGALTAKSGNAVI